MNKFTCNGTGLQFVNKHVSVLFDFLREVSFYALSRLDKRHMTFPSLHCMSHMFSSRCGRAW